MDRDASLQGTDSRQLYESLKDLHEHLQKEFAQQFNRSIPFADEILDRWERSRVLGFGEGSSIYDSSYVFGDVQVGMNTWIGPFTIIDGSGGLSIGNNCTISAGVHIYSHSNLMKTLSGGTLPMTHKPVAIGNNTYISPQCIISAGVSIGNGCLLAANSFLNSDMPDFTIFAGNPARQIGNVLVQGDQVQLQYVSK